LTRIFLTLAVICGSLGLFAQSEAPTAPEAQNRGALRDFDLRGDGKMLFESVAKAYGLGCVFDESFAAGSAFRFQMQQVDYRTALHALEEATGSFVVPLSGQVMLVMKDSPDNRRTREPYEAVTVEIPQATTPQEVTEAVQAVQQVMALERVGIQTQGNRVALRGPASKIVPAQKIFEELIQYRPQVSIEMDVMEVSLSDVLTYGIDIPSSPLFTISPFSSNGIQLAALAKGALGMALGVSLIDAQLVAQMQKSNAHSLLHFQIRASNHQPASFHSGD